ncbi:nuclear protein 2 [Pangshura tecta]
MLYDATGGVGFVVSWRPPSAAEPMGRRSGASPPPGGRDSAPTEPGSAGMREPEAREGRAGLDAARPQKAAPPGAEEAEARYDPYEWYNVREWSGPRGPGSGGKGRSRRERELRTNRHLPAGHERKIAQKLRNSQAKRRRREQRGPRSTRAGRRSARAE